MQIKSNYSMLEIRFVTTYNFKPHFQVLFGRLFFPYHLFYYWPQKPLYRLATKTTLLL